jgi:predicted DNA-binding transcriptional regulator AlpA
MTNRNTSKNPRFSKLDSVSEQTGMGKSTILAWESSSRFPRAVRLSPTIRVWLQQDIDNWVREKHEKAIAPTNSLELEEAQDACKRESKA